MDLTWTYGTTHRERRHWEFIEHHCELCLRHQIAAVTSRSSITYPALPRQCCMSTVAQLPSDLGLQAWYSMILALKILNISPVEALQYRNRSSSAACHSRRLRQEICHLRTSVALPLWRRTSFPGCHPLNTASSLHLMNAMDGHAFSW